MVNLSLDFPDDFFEEEVRSEHLVTAEMKKVWAVELDLLAEFQRVCQKHNIKYFANAGTFLGAIRHKGFIPWDDDIDITMLREDYDRLCKIAPVEFKHPYFWQTEYTDKGSLRGHAQLRNSDTTGILKGELKQKKNINQGIFIDIFPYDVVVEDKTRFEEQKRKAQQLKKRSRRLAKLTDHFKNDSFSFPKNIFAFPLHLILNYIVKPDYTEPYQRFEKECAKYNDQESTYISCLSFSFDELHFQYREDYNEMVMVPFETLEIPVPRNYEKNLNRRFGDYTKFVKGGSYHGGVIFDTDKPYTEYLK